MACATIHLSIAKKYLQKHPNLNYEEFIAGTLYPDVAEDNDKSHYTDINRGTDNVSHVRGKVNLFAFLESHPEMNDFEKGWFLHLVTDYLFFLECFSEAYLLSITYDEFCKELYHAYSCINSYLEEKFDLNEDYYKAYPSAYYPEIPYEECILPINLVDEFIERVSKIDLEKYIKKIQKFKTNIKP